MIVVQQVDVDLVERLEAERVVIQDTLDRTTSPSERNRTGQFATPPLLAEQMVKLAHESFPQIQYVRFLDPGLGTGVFFSKMVKTYGVTSIRSAEGYEIDGRLAEIADRLWGQLGLRVITADFTRAQPPAADAEKPNLIICNPPYVRHHHLDAATKVRLRRSLERSGLNLNGLAGLYCYFILLSDEWLADNGGAVWIVPAEFLDVNYGTAIRRYLSNDVTTLRIHRFRPSDSQFSNAMVTSVIIAFRKARPAQNHQVLFTSGNDLLAPEFSQSVQAKTLSPREKWSRYFSSKQRPTETVDSLTLGDLFSVKRGIATGANDFFILEESKAHALGLPATFLRPILPSHRFIPTDVIDGGPNGFPLGIPRLVLLDCSVEKESLKTEYPQMYSYILEGERRGLPRRFLLRNRSPWYRQERRPPPPILCTYMARKRKDGRSLRFIRNRSQATTTNVYLLLYPKPGLAERIRSDPSILDAIYYSLREIPNLEAAGRVYGGGLHKLEPRELEKLHLPSSFLKWANGRSDIKSSP